MRQKIQLVWFKRDLRWFDNKPVYDSIQGNLPTLYFALYEPSLFELQQYDERHLRFIADSIEDLNQQAGNGTVHFIRTEALDFFKKLIANYDIVRVFSHKETGIKHTFDRDIAIHKLFKSHGIPWLESDANGVRRGLRNRRDWVKKWHHDAAQPLINIDLKQISERALAAPNFAELMPTVFEEHPFFSARR